MSEDRGTVVHGSGDGDAELLVALRHELRRRILCAMFEEDAPSSPGRLAQVLKVHLSNVSYHVRVLAECGAVQLVDTEPVRGSMQHFYRPSVGQAWALTILGIEDGDEESTPTPERAASPTEERSR